LYITFSVLAVNPGQKIQNPSTKRFLSIRNDEWPGKARGKKETGVLEFGI